MKIVHVCLCGPFTDGWNYQENLLTKYHSKMGAEVTVVASQWVLDSNGETIRDLHNQYINHDGVKIIRIKNRIGNVDSKFKRYENFIKYLEQERPDILFVHGCQFIDLFQVRKYVKSNKTRLYIDNHADSSNSGKNWISRIVIHGILWRIMAQSINRYVLRFFGVLPARVDFLINVYKIPKEKVKLLVMGADDERVNEASKLEVRKKIRDKLGLEDDDFVIMTGGKIDAFKTQTLLLMEAVHKIDDPKVKLIVFGSVTPELKEKVNELSDGKKNQYIGWVNADESYDYFAASDLVVFPGRHSVFWEQVAAQGKPMVVKYWEGTTHVDFGGNVRFLYEDSSSEIEKNIRCILSGDEYDRMLLVAKEASANFMYSKIAEESIKG